MSEAYPRQSFGDVSTGEWPRRVVGVAAEGDAPPPDRPGTANRAWPLAPTAAWATAFQPPARCLWSVSAAPGENGIDRRAEGLAGPDERERRPDRDALRAARRAPAGSASRYTRFCFGWMLGENVPSGLSESLSSAVVHGWPGPSCTSSETRWCGRGHTRPVIANRRACDRPRRPLEPDADDPEVVRAEAERRLGARAAVAVVGRPRVERGVRDALRRPVDRQVDRPHLALDPERAGQPARREDPRPPGVVRVQALRPVVAVADGDEVRLAAAPPRRLLGRRPAARRRREEPDGDAPRVPQHLVRGVGDGRGRSRPPRARSGRRPGCACPRTRRRATSGGASRRRRTERRRPARAAPRAATTTASRSGRRRAGSTRAARRRRASATSRTG